MFYGPPRHLGTNTLLLLDPDAPSMPATHVQVCLPTTSLLSCIFPCCWRCLRLLSGNGGHLDVRSPVQSGRQYVLRLDRFTPGTEVDVHLRHLQVGS